MAGFPMRNFWTAHTPWRLAKRFWKVTGVPKKGKGLSSKKHHSLPMGTKGCFFQRENPEWTWMKIFSRKMTPRIILVAYYPDHFSRNTLVIAMMCFLHISKYTWQQPHVIHGKKNTPNREKCRFESTTWKVTHTYIIFPGCTWLYLIVGWFV